MVVARRATMLAVAVLSVGGAACGGGGGSLDLRAGRARPAFDEVAGDVHDAVSGLDDTEGVT
jgi:hypothetical protein